MHPAAKLQFERMVGEYARWRAVPERNGRPRRRGGGDPRIELRDMALELPSGLEREVGPARWRELCRRRQSPA